MPVTCVWVVFKQATRSSYVFWSNSSDVSSDSNAMASATTTRACVRKLSRPAHCDSSSLA
eukprot:7180663-Heterocapsa_arctica.AAC.1